MSALDIPDLDRTVTNRCLKTDLYWSRYWLWHSPRSVGARFRVAGLEYELRCLGDQL